MKKKQADVYTQGSEKKPVKSRYQVRVVSEVCSGASLCIAEADEMFELNYMTGRADITDQDAIADAKKLAVAKICPTGAIEIIDTKTGEKIWPK
jgi:ferredoxin